MRSACASNSTGLKSVIRKKCVFPSYTNLPVVYKSVQLDCGYRLDIVVEERVIVELKAVERLMPIHEAQILTYLKLSQIKTGLLMNFNSVTLKEGLRRFVL
jgi:GxxExxY protein